jgi:O-antigen/teichoic acid export membrane protein
VIFSRGLSFLRVLVVAKLLGDAGQREFGLYQPALELVNWLVPVVMLGLGDVAERYAVIFENRNLLGAMIRRHLLQLSIIGGGAILLLTLGSSIFAELFLGVVNASGAAVVIWCAVTVFALAVYQYVAALLRGMRAYAASAGMEATSAVLLLAFSAIGAVGGQAVFLVIAYALSIILPLGFYLVLLARHLRGGRAAPAVQEAADTASAPVLEYATPISEAPNLTRFARFSVLRLMLVMTFGFLTIWSVRALSRPAFDPMPFYNYRDYALEQTANFAMPYRIAQLLAYLAVTIWAASYGIAAHAWSHGHIRRAKAELFRVGKFGGVLLTLLAVGLLLSRSLFALVLPLAYGDAIMKLLPAMLALFMWYGFLTFSTVYADLQEKPHLGALAWAVAIVIQVTVLVLPLGIEAPRHVLTSSILAVVMPLVFFAPLVCRPVRFSAVGIPLALMVVGPVSLLTPPWIVDYVAPPVMLGVIGFLLVSGLLIRPLDRRRWRRFRAR